MNAKLIKHIAMLLTCLCFCSQAYAEKVDLNTSVLDPFQGTTMENPFEIEISGRNFSFFRSERYSEGSTTKLSLYYRMQIDRPMVINLKSDSNVPLNTFIKMNGGRM